MEGNPAFFVLFRSRNFGSAKPAAAHDANAFGAHAHRRCNRHFHGAPERHPAFELPRDILGEQKTVQLGTLNLMNENFHLFVGDLLELLFQLRDLFTAPPDHDAGAGRMDRDHGFLGSSVDQDPRDPGLFQPVVDIVPDAQIFLEFPGKIFVVVPIRIPRAQDAEPKSDRMYFLTQRTPYSFSFGLPFTFGFSFAFTFSFGLPISCFCWTCFSRGLAGALAFSSR